MEATSFDSPVLAPAKCSRLDHEALESPELADSDIERAILASPGAFLLSSQVTPKLVAALDDQCARSRSVTSLPRRPVDFASRMAETLQGTVDRTHAEWLRGKYGGRKRSERASEAKDAKDATDAADATDAKDAKDAKDPKDAKESPGGQLQLGKPLVDLP